MKTFKRIFLYSILAILMFYVFLVDVNVEGQLAISVFAQERETIFEGFDTQMDSFVDAMTDEKSGAIFVFFGPIYMAIYGHNDFTIWSYGNYMNFAPDATHLIRVEGNKPFSLTYRDKLNSLSFANHAEAESVIQALVKGEEINLRYYEDKGNRYNQVDSKLQNIFLGFVYCEAAKLFGWKDFGVSPDLPLVKLNIYTPTKPGIKSYARIDVQGNPELMLINNKAEAGAFNYSMGAWNASIMVGKEQVFGLSSDGEWICRGGSLNLFASILGKEHVIIRDSNGIMVLKEELKWTGGWPGGETVAKKAWEVAPLGSIDIEGDGKGKVLLYGFRELWKWGVDNLNFPSLDDIEDHKEEAEAKDTGKNFKITDYQAQVKILESGDIQVSEIFTYDFDGNFNGIIRSIGTGGSDGLAYFRASEYSPQRKVLETSQSVEGDIVTFRIYDQSSNERKSFLLEYQLKNVITKYNDIAEFYWKFFDQTNTSPVESIKVEVEFFKEISKEKINASGFGPLGRKIFIQENGKVVYEVGRLSPGEKLGVKILFTNDSSPQISTATYPLQGNLHCPDKTGYACPSCTAAQGYDNHFKGFNVLTTNEDCYVKLTYNNGDYIGNQNNCEVIIKGEKWLGLENESGTKLGEEINKGNFDFKPANKFVERTMNFPGDNYRYEFANEGKEFRLYLSRKQEEAFKAVPWQNITVEIKNKETNKVFKYKLQKGIFPQAYSWSNGVANYGQCVWWAAKRWVEEVDSKILFPFYPPSPESVNVKKIDSNYQPKRFDVLINYNPGGPPEHYGFVEKVDGDKTYITQFNWIKPGEVYNYIIRTWNGNVTSLFYSNNFYEEYYFKYYYRRVYTEITPVFTDSFEDMINENNRLTNSFYNQKIYSSNDISFIEKGKIGKAVHLNSLSSYVGYQGKYINPDEGTIRFYFKPDFNFYKFYNLRQSTWKDYSKYKTPFGGFLVDTVAYLPAFTGSFFAFLGFSGDINSKNTNLAFATRNSSAWSYATYSNKDDLTFSSSTWYDFAFTWSKREEKIKIFIDGIEKASANFNTSLSDKEPFFIGENPFEYSGTSYWPYGPHSLIGTYDELRIYDEALDFKE